MQGGKRSRRDWLVDTAFFLVAVLFGLVLVGEAPESTSEALLAADFAVGSIACLALWWRRRWPVGVALALAVPAPSDMASAAVLIALFTVAVHRPRPVVAAVSAVHVVALTLVLVLRPDPDAPFLLMLAILLPLFAAVLAWGMFIRARRQLIESLRDQARWVETEKRLLVEQARQVERTQIAREMHDVLAHRISFWHARGRVGVSTRRPRGRDREGRGHHPGQRAPGVGGSPRGNRRAPAGAGRHRSQRPQPTLADLPALVDDPQAGAHVRTDFRFPDLAGVPTAIGRGAYRIVQEGRTTPASTRPAPGST